MILRLGNASHPDLDRESVTTAVFPDDLSVDAAIVNVTHPDGVWAAHSTEPPLWVASDNEDLARRLGAFYGVEVREL